MKEFENMDNLKEDLFETLADMFNPMKREDEYNEVQVLDALQRLQGEDDMLAFKLKSCYYSDRMHDAQQIEYLLEMKQNEIQKLREDESK